MLGLHKRADIDAGDSEKQRIETMDSVYKFSSTERIVLLEKELAVKLSELKTEVEDQGLFPGTGNRIFSSVQIPKDVAHFRREREAALKRTLQADVLKRELESCLRREYTPENLPLLLLQYYTERITQLGQSKYLHVLRWKRLCQTSMAMEELYPLYKALQYLPISRVLSLAAKQVSGSSEEDGKACVTDLHAASPGPLGPHVSGSGRTDAAFVLPQHVTDRDDLKPQLRRLLSHFHIPDDVQKLSDSAKEMGLFSSVSQNFQSIFMEQQRMWTFPDYEAGRGNVQNPTMSGPTTTLRKRADWIPFVKVKPKCDPWQKKMLTRLKERKRIDELMNLQSQFLKISDPVRVMQVLQDHAAKTVPMASNHPSRPPAQPLHPRNYDQVWKNIYSNPKLYQAENPSDDDFAKPHLSQSSDGSLKQRTETGYNFAVALQLLGLSDGTEPDRNPVLMRGAYLSFLCLRHLHIRELQRICLGVLNFFRSVERTLTMNTSGLTLVSGTLVPTLGDSSWINMSKGGMGTLQGLGTHHYIHGTPAEHKESELGL